jgi:uncharacterized protein YkwD
VPAVASVSAADPESPPLGAAAVRLAAAGANDPSPPAGQLSVRDARRYMLALINRDRAREGLAAVDLDEGPPTVAAQRHAADMASHGYLGHWGTDGSVPEQRLTEAGGVDMVSENALCYTDERPRKLDPSPQLDAARIEKAERMFFDEVPPNDGHRKNILKPFHKRVGIGIAQSLATATEIPVPCIDQEFTDPYGTYAPVARAMHVGDRLQVEGRLSPGASVGGVGLARVDLPKSIDVAELNTRRSYLTPAPYQMYWPPGFVTPIPLQVKGHAFSIDLPVSDHDKKGLYELSIWAKVAGGKDFVIVGLRTILVE